MATKSILNEKLKQEQRKKEDRAFYIMLIAIAVALVVESALIFLYRAYSDGAEYGSALHIVVWTFLGITALSGAAFIYFAATKKFKFLKPLLAIGGVFFVCAEIFHLTNLFGTEVLSVATIVCPGLLLLFIIYMIYQPEFFLSALFGSLGVFSVWITKKVFYLHYHQRLYVMIGVIVLLILVAGATYIAKKNYGYLITKGDWRLRIFSPKTSYKSLFITFSVTLGLLIAYLLLETFLYPVTIPFFIAFGGYIFASLIYYTIKLM